MPWSPSLRCTLWGPSMSRTQPLVSSANRKAGLSCTSRPRQACWHLGPSQLCCGETRHRGAIEVHRARHATIQCTVQLHLTVRVEPSDRNDTDRNGGREGTRFANPADGTGKIAPLAAFLLGDSAKDVTGQIFAVRINEIFLMGQSRPFRSIHRGRVGLPLPSPSTACRP
jgi:hypothetical protein